MASRRTNTQQGNPRHGKSYSVRKNKDGTTDHVYKGKTVTLMPKKTPVAKTPATPKVSAGSKVEPWYSQTGQSDLLSAFTGSMKDPLKPLTGSQAGALATGLQAAQVSPILQAFDRKDNLIKARDAEQQARNSQMSATAQDVLARQMAERQQAGGRAAGQVAQAGQQAQASIAQVFADADRAASNDAALRGSGLDGGSAAMRAQAAASARARGEASTQIAQQGLAAQGSAADALLQSIAGASAQQAGERQGAIANQTTSQLRDSHDGRVQALSGAQGDLVKTMLGLRENAQQTELGQMAIRGDAYEAELKARTEAAAQAAKAKESSAERQLKRDIAQANIDARSSLESRRQSGRERLEEIKATAAGRRAAEKYAADQRKDSAKKREKANAFVASVDTTVSNAAIRQILTRKNMDPRRVNQQLVNRGVKDALTRNLIVDRHVYGGPRPETVRAYRNKYGVNPPKRWTTKRGK